MESIRQVTKIMQAVSTETLIAKLNPIITGWSNYYSSVASKKTLNWCDHQMFILYGNGQPEDIRVTIKVSGGLRISISNTLVPETGYLQRWMIKVSQ